MQEQVITFATPVFIVLILLEMIISARRGQSTYFFSDTINSMGLGVISQVTSAFFKLLLIGIYAWVSAHFSLFKLPNAWWVWVGGLLLYDFLYYWLHRCGHEMAILWAAHVVHHQSERYNLTTALRQTSSGPLLAWIFYLPMAIIGVPVEIFVVIGLIDLLYQFWVHTELIGKLGWYDRVFVSPSNHRVHHATNNIYLDKNYGGILILWDRLFGTFIEEMDEHKVVYGTRKPLRSWNPITANIEVYQAVIKDAALASSWIDKLRFWIKHPGWQPADVAQKNPHAPFELHHPNFEPQLSPRLKWYCAAQFLFIFLITTHFLAAHASISTISSVLYAAWLIGGLVVVGGLTELKPHYLGIEAARLLFTAGFVMFSGQWFGEYPLSEPLKIGIVAVAMLSLVCLFALRDQIKTSDSNQLSTN